MNVCRCLGELACLLGCACVSVEALWVVKTPLWCGVGALSLESYVL
jgi:hypothetical protein